MTTAFVDTQQIDGEDEDNALKLWLKANAFVELLSKLNECGVKKLDDLKELENEDDVKELASELGIKVIKRKKFIRVVLALISSNNDESKSEVYESKQAEMDLPKKNRIIFKPGINVVPFNKTEYRLPKLKKSQLPSQGGKGFVHNAIITLWNTINKVVSINSEEQKHNVNKLESPTPERLFVDRNHKIILVCGKTGAGKTTLINSMMNYIYNVQHTDNFR
eukprot:128959_1